MTRAYCIDSFDTRLSVDAERSPEGYIHGRAPVTRCGVFPYMDQDGKVLMVARLPQHVLLKKSLDTLKRIPFQVDHVEFLDAGNMARLKVGNGGSDVEVDGEIVSIDFVIDVLAGIAAIDGGKQQLSCGYWHGLVFESGTYNGVAYDAYQVEIEYNHVAICQQARLGSDLRIDVGDAFKIPAGASGDSGNVRIYVRSADGVTPPSSKDTSMSLRKITLDSIDYEVPPQVAVAFAKMQADATDMASQLLTAQTAKTTADTALATETSAHDATKALLKAEKDGFEGRVTAETEARAALDAVAVKFLSETERTALKGKPALDTKTAIVKKWKPTLDLTGKDATFINTLYLAAEHDGEPGTNSAAEGRAAGGAGGHAPAAGSMDALLEEQRKDLTNLASK